MCCCNSKGKCTPAMIARILLIIGGINWGLVGIGMLAGSDLNVVHMLLGEEPSLEAFVYVLVGIAAVMKIVGCKCKKCAAACDSCSSLSADSKTGGSM